MTMKIEVAIITTAPAAGCTLLATAKLPTLQDAVDFMNKYAKGWAAELKEQDFEVDDDSMPHNENDPMELNEEHTWLTASQGEYEFMAAWRQIAE